MLRQTLWPALVTTTSLPPNIRMDAENVMVAALWFGPCKPPMSKIEELESRGIEFMTPEGTTVLKTKLVIGVFDFPAKVSALNVVQYNGYYGCPYCTDKGVHKSHRHLYLPSEPHNLRFQSDINH